MKKKRLLYLILVVIGLASILILFKDKRIFPFEKVIKTSTSKLLLKPHLETEDKLSKDKQQENNKGYEIGTGL